MILSRGSYISCHLILIYPILLHFHIIFHQISELAISRAASSAATIKYKVQRRLGMEDSEVPGEDGDTIGKEWRDNISEISLLILL